ncbi:MAG: type IV pilus assembly protein PilM [Candidatus Omnitrophica bacterium]|nr:type IV pilus assembly protein PilM [Candidatus Omnitrophota bacterium]
MNPGILIDKPRALAVGHWPILERFRGSQKPRRWVGLDMGSSSIKLVELEQAASGPRLIKQLIQELPLSPEGQSVDRSGWLQSALKEFDNHEVHLALSGPEVAVRRVRVPPMSMRELPEAVKWQVKDELPFPIQEAALDFRVIGEVWEKDLKQQDVVVAAVHKPFLEGLLGVVERAGGHVVSALPTPLALWACVEALLPEARHGSVVVLELGAEATHAAIVKDGHVRVVRDLAIGSATMTEALIGETVSDTGAIPIDRSLAETFKRRYGVLMETPEGTTEEGIPLFYLASLLRPVLENLLTELSRFLDFYKVQMEQGGISRVLLCGGGANLRQLQPFLAEGLGLPVEVFNPLIRIPDRVQQLEPEQIAEGGFRLAVAIGVALDHGQGLNLLHAQGRRAKPFLISRRVFATAATALGACALMLYLGLQLCAGILQRQLRHQQTRWAQVEPAYTEYLHVTSTRKTLEGTIERVQQFLDQQPVWEGIFKELGTLIPPPLQLDTLTVSADRHGGPAALRFHVKGTVASGSSAQAGRLSQFVEALERSVFFSHVELTSSELHSGDSDTTSFDITGAIE